jgi:hypothetical protein
MLNRIICIERNVYSEDECPHLHNGETCSDYHYCYVNKVICDSWKSCSNVHCLHIKAHEKTTDCNNYCRKFSKPTNCRKVNKKS